MRKTTLPLILLSVINLLLISFRQSNSAESLKATYDAGTGSCSGAPESLCGPMNISLHQGARRTSGQSLSRSAACQEGESSFGSLVKTKLNTTIAQATTSVQGNFKRLTLDRRPAWAVSAAWESGERHLLIVDVKNGSILRFDLNGHLDETIEFKAGNGPAFIYRQKDGGYLIKDARTRVSWLGEDLASNREADLRDSSNKQILLDSVFGLSPIDDNMLIFGDIKTSSQGDSEKKDWMWKSALVRTRPGRASCVETIHSMETNDPARNFYLLGYPLLATASNKGYALIMSDKPYILEAGFGVRRLVAFPPMHGRPVLPEHITKDNVVDAYNSIAKSKTAVGLIGWKDSLFVLARQPGRAQATQWQLWKVDPARDVIVNRPIVLPTNAQHIILVPGNRYWAIVEKGRVLAPQVQEVSSVVLVPSSSLLTTSDKLVGGRAVSLTAR
jgi:hypothetical protein